MPALEKQANVSSFRDCAVRRKAQQMIPTATTLVRLTCSFRLSKLQRDCEPGELNW